MDAAQDNDVQTVDVVVTYQVTYRTTVQIPAQASKDGRREAMLDRLESINIPEHPASEYVDDSFKPVSFTDTTDKPILRNIGLL